MHISGDDSEPSEDGNLRNLGKARPKEPQTPLPWFQLFVVLLIQFAEPITATVIYPFAPAFVRRTGITGGDEKKTGYFAGIIESAFFIAECLTVYHWARLSDYVGRRPVLLIAPLGQTVAMLGFGLSKSFWSLLAFRCAQGVFNGNIGVSKTIIAEITDSTNIGDAFTMIPLMWSFGTTSGPLIGGSLSDAATRWPTLFGRYSLFRENPYFLPCATAGFVCVLAFVFGYFALKETLPRIVARERKKPAITSPTATLVGAGNGAHSNYGSTATTTTSSILEAGADSADENETTLAEKPFTLMEMLRHAPLATALSSYAFLAFCDMSYMSLLPLVYSTSIPIGGLGFSPSQIGAILATLGVVAALVQIFVLSRIYKHYGPRTMFLGSLVSLWLALAAYPVMTYFARRAGRVDGVVWAVLVVQLTCSLMSYMAYTSIQVLIIDSAPSKGALASTNSLAQMIACFIRSLAPSIASSLYSVSLERNLMGGYMGYIVLLGVTTVGIRFSFNLHRELRTVQ